jgi:hypothetical protein
MVFEEVASWNLAVAEQTDSDIGGLVWIHIASEGDNH